MSCLIRKSVCQHKSANLDYEADWAVECAYLWEAGRGWALNEVVRTTDATGYEGRVTTAGQSGAREPKFRGVEADIITDGSVGWTLQRTSAASLRKTISDSIWSAPAAVVVTNDVVLSGNGNQKTRALIACQTPGTYEIVNTVTFSDGSVGVAIFDLEVEE